MRKYIIGVDVGGSSIKFGRFDLNGELLNKWSVRTDKSNNGENILNQIATSIASRYSFKSIEGIGFGLPGPVIKNTVINCVNLGWSKRNIETEFRDIIKDDEIIIKVGNDANVAAAGEMYKGIARGYKDVVLFTLGTGVGGGIIIDNKIFEGFNGVAGELGHIRVDFFHNYQCKCGKIGCLETVASATGIVNLAKDNLLKYSNKSPLRKYEGFSAKKVIDYAKLGDFIALKALEEAMMYLASAMATVTNVINPEVFVIGGGVSNAGSFIIDLVTKYYYDMVKPFISQTNFAIAELGNDAGIYGCCYMVKK